MPSKIQQGPVKLNKVVLKQDKHGPVRPTILDKVKQSSTASHKTFISIF